MVQNISFVCSIFCIFYRTDFIFLNKYVNVWMSCLHCFSSWLNVDNLAQFSQNVLSIFLNSLYKTFTYILLTYKDFKTELLKLFVVFLCVSNVALVCVVTVVTWDMNIVASHIHYPFFTVWLYMNWLIVIELTNSFCTWVPVFHVVWLQPLHDPSVTIT